MVFAQGLGPNKYLLAGERTGEKEVRKREGRGRFSGWVHSMVENYFVMVRS